MFKLLKKFDKYDFVTLFFIIGFIVCQVWLDLTMPDYTTKLAESIASGGVSSQAIWENGLMMLLCAFGSLVSSFACVFLSARLASKFSKNLRGSIYNKISTFSSTEMKKFSIPSLITRSTNDVVQMQMFIAMGLQVLIKAPILAIWAISKISSASIEWTSAILITVVVLIALIGVVVGLVLPKFRKVQKLIDNLNDVTRENVEGVRVVRAFNAEDYQQNKFETANNNLTKNQLFTAKVTGLMMPIMTLCMNGLTLAIYWIGAILVNNAPVAERALVIGNMVAFTQYAMQVVMAFIMLVVVFIILPRAIVSARRINEVLDTVPAMQEGEKENTSDIKGQVEFRNVSYKYEDGQDNVLSNITFSANKGETVAIIGATGSGKTSLINLIPRLIDASEGEVLVDGMNVKDYKQEDLQKRIAVVAQKACLFKGDIKSNITYGYAGDVDENKENIRNAINISEAKFVHKLKKGIESDVAQGGSNFSGGQKQRISIARAIFKDAEIIIFDDSFSALDYKTDMLVRKNIKNKLDDKTLIIVAQRIGTIKEADKIIVLDDGKIAGMGRHDELLENCPLYKEIALSQLSKEEL